MRVIDLVATMFEGTNTSWCRTKLGVCHKTPMNLPKFNASQTRVSNIGPRGIIGVICVNIHQSFNTLINIRMVNRRGKNSELRLSRSICCLWGHLGQPQTWWRTHDVLFTLGNFDPITTNDQSTPCLSLGHYKKYVLASSKIPR